MRVIVEMEDSKNVVDPTSVELKNSAVWLWKATRRHFDIHFNEHCEEDLVPKSGQSWRKKKKPTCREATDGVRNTSARIDAAGRRSS